MFGEKMERQPKQQDDINYELVIKNYLTNDDYFHVACLKPGEYVLDQPSDGLAIGLKHVKRQSQLQYTIQEVQTVLSLQQYLKQQKGRKGGLSRMINQTTYDHYIDYIQKNNGDNLLAQMKAHGDLQMVICICMYNEDRQMLQNTLAGVGENILKLSKEGVDPDKIAVIVVQDGIEKMNPSIISLFGILEKESGMHFDDGSMENLEDKIQRIKRIQEQQRIQQYVSEEEMEDLNIFLFSQEELEERKKLRFLTVKKEYDQIKSLYNKVQELMKKQRVLYDELPPKVAQFFKAQFRMSMEMQNRLNKFEGNLQDLPEFQQLIDDAKKSKKYVNNALYKAQSHCRDYIQSRSAMSHVSYFRTGQFFPDQFIKEEMNKSSLHKAQRSRTKIQSQQTIELKGRNICKAHINEEENQLFLENEPYSIKMNLFFVVKYRNAQKLSSHNWFFNGFCKEFSNGRREGKEVKLDSKSPKYCILLDVGLRPDEDALYKMYYTMVNNPQVGGVCGYMGLKLEKSEEISVNPVTRDIDFFSSIFLNFVDIQRAQQLEYHFAHLIDKGFQSSFRFIHVLPGAFSGYNMQAIWGKDADQLLGEYFSSINDKLKNNNYTSSDLSLCQILSRILLPDFIVRNCISPVNENSYEQLLYNSNVNLAEDRILCMGIHKNEKSLIYLPDAYSYVDPVKDLPSLMGQRKRWINGSYFAFQKVSKEFSQMKGCSLLGIQINYLAFMNLLAYIAPAFFMFTVSVAMQAFRADVLVRFFSSQISETSQIYQAFVYTINFIYAMLISGLIYNSFCRSNKNPYVIKYTYAVSTILGVMSFIIMTILIVDLVRGLGKSASYLISSQSPTFVENIPGGKDTVDLLRYIVLGIMGLYAVPVIFYSILFCNFRIIPEIIAGTISFIFYTPTYLIILNIYALCRMDDLSWGTKGIDGGSSKNQQCQKQWKIIKTIHVGKLIFWNVVVAGILLHFASDYLIRFYLTFALMILIAVTMVIKVFLAICYYFGYKFCYKNQPSKKNGNEVFNESQPTKQYINTQKLQKPVNSSLFADYQSPRNMQDHIFEVIKNNLKDLKNKEVFEYILSMKIISQQNKKQKADEARSRNSTPKGKKIHLAPITEKFTEEVKKNFKKDNTISRQRQNKP